MEESGLYRNRKASGKSKDTKGDQEVMMMQRRSMESERRDVHPSGRNWNRAKYAYMDTLNIREALSTEVGSTFCV